MKSGRIVFEDFDPQADYRDWLWSEKLDGVRFEWDGSELRTKQGKDIDAPAALLESLPEDVKISGEIWCGRGRLDDAIAAVRGGRDHPAWQDATLIAFDLPGCDCDLATLITFFGALDLPVIKFGRVKRLAPILADIVGQGGEGLVLRHPGGRRAVKVKPVEDEEGTVIAHNEKSSVRVRTGAGREFSLPVHGQKPAVGARVTYTFQGRTKTGLPRHAAFKCVRDYESPATAAARRAYAPQRLESWRRQAAQAVTLGAVCAVAGWAVVCLVALGSAIVDRLF